MQARLQRPSQRNRSDIGHSVRQGCTKFGTRSRSWVRLLVHAAGSRPGRYAGPAVSDAAIRYPVERIEVRIQVGDDRMAATDDPVFLGLRGAAGREFRLQMVRGPGFRRGSDTSFVLASAGAPDTNVAHAELNDPTAPALCADAIESCYVRKGSEPLPNVRGLGEMDDRIQILRVEVDLQAGGLAQPRRFVRQGPFWLGLVSGTVVEVPAADDEA